MMKTNQSKALNSLLNNSLWPAFPPQGTTEENFPIESLFQNSDLANSTVTKIPCFKGRWKTFWHLLGKLFHQQCQSVRTTVPRKAQLVSQIVNLSFTSFLQTHYLSSTPQIRDANGNNFVLRPRETEEEQTQDTATACQFISCMPCVLCLLEQTMQRFLFTQGISTIHHLIGLAKEYKPATNDGFPL